MDYYGRIFFDSSASRDNMLFMGNNNPSFRVHHGPRILQSMEEDQARKRPFFMSRDELIYDEEYYDEQLPEKKRRLTSEQVHMLEKSFKEENKLEPERKTELAKKLGLQPRQVAVWFQNRRARSKSKQLERDYDLLKASYDSLLSNYETMVKENEKLKFEVHSLTEKFQAKDISGQGPRSDPIHQMSAQQQLGPCSSSIVNEENPQLVVDSEDSTCFDCPSPPPPYIVTIRSEEDDTSDDGRSYFPDMFMVVADHQEEVEGEEGQDLGWWVWS